MLPSLIIKRKIIFWLTDTPGRVLHDNRRESRFNLGVLANAHKKFCCNTTSLHASVMNVELIRKPTFHLNTNCISRDTGKVDFFLLNS